MGENPCDLGMKNDETTFDKDVEFVFVERDIMRSFINGIPSINFLERINQLLIKDMSYAMVIKLLGRALGMLLS